MYNTNTYKKQRKKYKRNQNKIDKKVIRESNRYFTTKMFHSPSLKLMRLTFVIYLFFFLTIFDFRYISEIIFRFFIFS